jgi:hypothetical protein
MGGEDEVRCIINGVTTIQNEELLNGWKLETPSATANSTEVR